MASSDTIFTVPDTYGDVLGGGGGFFDPIRAKKKQEDQTAMAKKRWSGDIQDLLDAYALQKASGIGSEKALMRRLRLAGIEFDEAGNPISPEGYTAFDPTTATSSDRNRLRQELRGPGFRGSLYRNAFQEYRTELAKKKLDQYKQETVDPLFKNVSDSLNEMLTRGAYTGEELGMVRSELTSNVRGVEAQRLRKIAAVTGNRGLDPGSSTGAILVNRAAQETDNALTEALRRLGLDVLETERMTKTGTTALAGNLGTALLGVNQAYEMGDLEALGKLASEGGSILESLNALNATTRAQKDANRLGFYGALGSGVAQGLGNALG